MAVAVIRGFAWFAIGYFTLLNTVYLVLIVLAAAKTITGRGRVPSGGLAGVLQSPLTPPISLVVPVRNMAGLIAGSTRGLLGLRYPEFEVIVVDDGSTDGTFACLEAEFGLVEIDMVLRGDLAAAGRVRSVHAPGDGGNLLVIRKQSTGRPADAVNAGLGAARYPLACRVDADTYLDQDALLTIVEPFIEDPGRVVAAGAAIRVANGCEIRAGRVTRPRVPGGWLLPIQAAEYLRSFLLGHAGWSQLRGVLFTSGGLSACRRDTYLRSAGAGRRGGADDLEMTMRIHHRFRDDGQPYRIGFIPEPCCWTVVPQTYRDLARQRARWSQQLAGALWAHRKMLFNPRYGTVGLLVLPFALIFELASAVVEVLAVAAFGAGLALGALSPQAVPLFAAAAFGYGAFLTIVSVITEELAYHRYGSWRDFALLVYAALAENAGFRQVHAWWRLRGIAAAVLGREPDWLEEPGAPGRSGPVTGVAAGERQVPVP